MFLRQLGRVDLEAKDAVLAQLCRDHVAVHVFRNGHMDGDLGPAPGTAELALVRHGVLVDICDGAGGLLNDRDVGHVRPFLFALRCFFYPSARQYLRCR